MFTLLIIATLIVVAAGSNNAQTHIFQSELTNELTLTKPEFLNFVEDLNDIKYTPEQLEWLQTPAELRAGVIFPSQKWPQATVPYTISASIPPGQRKLIPQAMKMIEDGTCINFVERTTERNYMDIVRAEPGACWSQLGFLGGRQELNLGGWGNGRPCEAGSTAHEIMHTLGIEHEQNRPDRDDYIKVDFSRIPRDWWSQYEKNDPARRGTYGLPYSYDSIMHYHVFSPDGSSTQVMFPRKNVNINGIGQRDHLAQGDIDLINKMYCEKQKPE